MPSLALEARSRAPRSSLLHCRRLEVVLRHVAGLCDSTTTEHCRNRARDDLEVERKAPVVDVPDVERESLFPRLRVATVDLRPTRDARPHIVATALVRVISRQVLDEKGPWPHEAHVPAQHVPQLGQLVE